MEKIYFYTRDIELKTLLNKEEILERLVQCTEIIDLSKFRWRIPKSDKTFYGTINIDNFYMVSNLKYYKNSFNPFLSGYIYSEENVNKVKIKFRMNKFIAFLIYLQLTFLSLIAIATLITYTSFSNLLAALFPILFMLTIVLSLSLWGFNNEANYNVRVLKKQLNTID